MGAPATTALGKWGLVHGWLASDAERRLELRAMAAGMMVRVVASERDERIVEVGVLEDPSSAAWRAIAELDSGQ